MKNVAKQKQHDSFCVEWFYILCVICRQYYIKDIFILQDSTGSGNKCNCNQALWGPGLRWKALYKSRNIIIIIYIRYGFESKVTMATL